MSNAVTTADPRQIGAIKELSASEIEDVAGGLGFAGSAFGYNFGASIDKHGFGGGITTRNRRVASFWVDF